jgi:hypothetical protein
MGAPRKTNPWSCPSEASMPQPIGHWVHGTLGGMWTLDLDEVPWGGVGCGHGEAGRGAHGNDDVGSAS